LLNYGYKDSASAFMAHIDWADRQGETYRRIHTQVQKDGQMDGHRQPYRPYCSILVHERP